MILSPATTLEERFSLSCDNTQKSYSCTFIASPTGVPRSLETVSPSDPAVGLCLGPYGGPGGGSISYERGTPVLDSIPQRVHLENFRRTSPHFKS